VFTVYRNYTGIKPEHRGAVVALGNFDGLHRGHQAVIAQAKSIADNTGARLGLAMFSPHPKRFFRPDSPPFSLMSARIRADILPGLGVSVCYEIPFDAALRDMNDTEFFEQVLHRGLGISHLVVGEDFGFGKNRCGDVDSLRRLCRAHGTGLGTVAPVGLHELYGKFGSTEIRDAIRNGNVFHAAHVLSRPWTVDGVVTHGDRIGRTIGYPTANIAYGDHIRPKKGIYCVEVRLSDDPDWYPAVASSGIRPTVGGTEERLEVHILDFDRDIYGQHADVRFRSFIRPEEKFDTVGAMQKQIARDVLGARAVFSI